MGLGFPASDGPCSRLKIPATACPGRSTINRDSVNSNAAGKSVQQMPQQKQGKTDLPALKHPP